MKILVFKLILISLLCIVCNQVVYGLNKKVTYAQVQFSDKKYPVKQTQNILVDDEVWPYFNWASFDQDKIISFGNYQYSIYWDADEVLVIVRRNLNDNSVQALRLPDNHLTINPQDGHRNTVIGISPNDGRLHLSWDHHCNDLRYTKSIEDFLTNPPETMSTNDFEPAQPLAFGAPQTVTYPRFFNDNSNNLYFVYRSGYSGFGDSIISSYNSENSEWTVIGRFLGQEGTFPPWDNSTNRNAYLNDVLFDKNNRLHITWLYREEAAGYGNNHDLYYAYSDDSGVTWMNNDGEEIADLSVNNPILISDPGIIVEEIPIYSWIINQCAMTIDSKNCPHVATYKLPIPQESPTIFPPPNLKEQQCFYHYWRDTDEKWHDSGPIDVPEGLSIGRPNIIVDSNDNVIIYWASKKGLYYYLAKADNQWKKWTLCSLTDENFTCNDPPKHDRRLLKNNGILSITVNPKAKEGGHGYAILDFDINDLVACDQKKIYNDNTSLQLLMHCDETNHPNSWLLSPDDNISGRDINQPLLDRAVGSWATDTNTIPTLMTNSPIDGNYLHFDGVDDTIYVSPGWKFRKNILCDFSFKWLGYPPASNPYAALVQTRAWRSFLRPSANGKCRVGFLFNGAIWLYSTKHLSSNTWYDVHFSLNDGEATLIIDDTTNTAAIAFTDEDSHLTIGNDIFRGDDRYFYGDIDEVRVGGIPEPSLFLILNFGFWICVSTRRFSGYIVKRSNMYSCSLLFIIFVKNNY